MPVCFPNPLFIFGTEIERLGLHKGRGNNFHRIISATSGTARNVFTAFHRFPFSLHLHMFGNHSGSTTSWLSQPRQSNCCACRSGYFTWDKWLLSTRLGITCLNISKLAPALCTQHEQWWSSCNISAAAQLPADISRFYQAHRECSHCLLHWGTSASNSSGQIRLFKSPDSWILYFNAFWLRGLKGFFGGFLSEANKEAKYFPQTAQTSIIWYNVGAEMCKQRD